MRRRSLSVGALAVAAVAAGTAFALLGWSAPGVPAAQSQYAPTNTSPPTISDTTPEVGQTLTGSNGQWSGDDPKTYAYQWLRCNASGDGCVSVPGATSQQYTVQSGDEGFTLRVRVTATNASGSNSAQSAATSRVGPAGTGTRNIADVSPPDRLLIDQVQFQPNPIRSRTAPITVRVRVLDSNGRAVQGALVFIRSTPLVTTTPSEQATGADGWVTLVMTPERDFSIVFRRGYNLQVFARARKPGENPLGGVSTRRLVQVGISPAG